MIALLDLSDKPAGFLRGGVTLRRGDVLGAPCVRVTLAPGNNATVLNRRLKAAERALRRARIGTVCFADSFPHSGYFTSRGYVEAGAIELFDAVSAEAAEYLAREGTAAYLYAPRPGDTAMRTLSVLCRRCRLVMADLPGGARQFDALRRVFGVSIVENAPARLRAETETAFIFGIPRFDVALPDSCVVYAIDPDALSAVHAARYVSALDVALPEGMESMLPEGFPRAPLIAEALRSLTISSAAPKLCGVRVYARETCGISILTK